MSFKLLRCLTLFTVVFFSQFSKADPLMTHRNLTSTEVRAFLLSWSVEQYIDEKQHDELLENLEQLGSTNASHPFFTGMKWFGGTFGVLATAVAQDNPVPEEAAKGFVYGGCCLAAAGLSLALEKCLSSQFDLVVKDHGVKLQLSDKQPPLLARLCC